MSKQYLTDVIKNQLKQIKSDIIFRVEIDPEHALIDYPCLCISNDCMRVSKPVIQLINDVQNILNPHYQNLPITLAQLEEVSISWGEYRIPLSVPLSAFCMEDIFKGSDTYIRHMYRCPKCHKLHYAWEFVEGINTIPAYRTNESMCMMFKCPACGSYFVFAVTDLCEARNTLRNTQHSIPLTAFMKYKGLYKLSPNFCKYPASYKIYDNTLLNLMKTHELVKYFAHTGKNYEKCLEKHSDSFWRTPDLYRPIQSLFETKVHELAEAVKRGINVSNYTTLDIQNYM